MRRLAVLALVASGFAAALAACGGASEPVGPPDGWTGTADRWWVPGADTAAAFRDLSSFEAMGVEPEADPYVRWVQDQMLPVYRNHPEVADSVFRAQFLPDLRQPEGGDAEALRVANEVKRDIYQRFNGSRKMTTGALTVPDSLAGVRGEIDLQVYVGADRQPLAVQLLSGTGTALDQIAMRDAATSAYSDGWVRPRSGPVAGVNIPTWVRVTHRFGVER